MLLMCASCLVWEPCFAAPDGDEMLNAMTTTCVVLSAKEFCSKLANSNAEAVACTLQVLEQQ